MKKQIATAILLGIGIGTQVPQEAHGTLTGLQTAMPRLEQGATCRPSQFGHLKSAGRFRRNDIASFFMDDGLLLAEWSGQVDAKQPERIDTEELDAEWMAHRHGENWFLLRRELVPTDGKTWSIQVYGNDADSTTVRLVATAAEGGGDAFTINYVQSAGSARLSIRGHRHGVRLRPWSATAKNLAKLREKHPIVVQTYLEPALGKIMA